MGDLHELSTAEIIALIQADNAHVGRLTALFLGARGVDDASWTDWLPDTSALWKAIEEFVSTNRAQMYQVLCVDWQACEKRGTMTDEALSEALKGILARYVGAWLADAGLVILERLPITILIGFLAVYLVRKGIQSLCACP